MDDTLLLDKTGPIASITLNNPSKGNPFVQEWSEAITDFLRQVNGDSTVRCVVLRATGKHFMSGGDMRMINSFLEAEATERQRLCEAKIRPWNTMIAEFQGLRKPVIARLQGAVVGPAIGLASACDFVLAAETAFFLFAHVMNGGSIDGQLTYYLPRILGPRKTYELCALGSKLSASEAKDLGLVNSVVPDDALDGEISRLAERLASGPTLAYAEIKALIQDAPLYSLTEQSEREAKSCGSLSTSADWQEGVQAFLQKRRPHFTGR